MPKIVESHKMKKYDKVLFQHVLRQINWETTLALPFVSDPSAMAGTFQEIFESLLNVHDPSKKEKQVQKLFLG